MLKTRLSLKTRLGLYLALTQTKWEISKFFFQKIKSTTMLVHHVKGQPAVSTYVQEKGGVKNPVDPWTPCSMHTTLKRHKGPNRG